MTRAAGVADEAKVGRILSEGVDAIAEFEAAQGDLDADAIKDRQEIFVSDSLSAVITGLTTIWGD